MRQEEITVETIDVEPADLHRDQSAYETVVFRVLPTDHPNSFTVPISVNLSQFPPTQAQAQARLVFHRLMRSLSEATASWEGADQETIAESTAPVSATEARLGPAGDPAEGKR